MIILRVEAARLSLLLLLLLLELGQWFWGCEVLDPSLVADCEVTAWVCGKGFLVRGGM